jgi:hypothetical protein
VTTNGADPNGAPEDRTRRPEQSDALAHFWRAAHELLAAARTVIDAADALVDDQLEGKRDEQRPRVRRIDVDDR